LKELRFKTEAQFRRYFERNLERFDVKSIKLSQNVCPDYVCIMKNGDVLNIEAEVNAHNFLGHEHDEGKVDLIVAAYSSTDRIHGIPVKTLYFQASEIVIVASGYKENADRYFLKEGRWKKGIIDESKAPQYFALYVKPPISAIDRLAKIKTVEMLPKERKTYFKFEWQTKLAHPILPGKLTKGIRGHRYTDLKTLLAAKTLDDLKLLP
jgi:hypothetical protein